LLSVERARAVHLMAEGIFSSHVSKFGEKYTSEGKGCGARRPAQWLLGHEQEVAAEITRAGAGYVPQS